MAGSKSVACHKRLTVYGVVQGIGFRPYVATLAANCGLGGSVKNSGGLVEITAAGPARNFGRFLKELRDIKLPFAKIERIDISDIPGRPEYTAFIIEESGGGPSGADILIPADLPVCVDCMAEAYDAENRRFRHPFISCSSCGPRYSIIKKLPYDRENTAMAEFQMCAACAGEYASRGDRRLHAQTIACHDCGPRLIFERGGRRLLRDEAFKEAVELIKNGGIAAVKGIGGFHFAVSPYDEGSAAALRALKSRETKPFAVMFPDMAGIEGVCAVSETERALLNSPERPIVLLDLKRSPFAESVLAGSPQCGAFLPYTPLHHMLLAECGPLVMTSANLSGAPIIKDDAAMLEFGRASNFGVLHNERRIIRSVEDSVVKALPVKRRESDWQLIRRARGYTPNPILIQSAKPARLLAAGGDLKAAFCLTKNGRAYVSQYLGDLESYESNAAYKEAARDLCGLLNIEPESAVCDMHPGYFSTGFAESLGLSVTYIQHHHAHAASVMAEHGLREAIGVVFDGTGYGADGNIWGGEFLLLSGRECERSGHLAYVDVIGGDASVSDALKTLDCYLYAAGRADAVTDPRFGVIEKALANKINVHKTSSAGRLFDALAAFLNLKHENSYEGECAVLLENSARLALKYGEPPIPLAFTVSENGGAIGWNGIFDALLAFGADKRKTDGFARAAALGFHLALARLVRDKCVLIREAKGVNAAALSGGVFQNNILLSESTALLEAAGFGVFVNRAVPANDGGICLGQAYLGCM